MNELHSLLTALTYRSITQVDIYVNPYEDGVWLVSASCHGVTVAGVCSLRN
jgi:hypothetical protein